MRIINLSFINSIRTIKEKLLLTPSLRQNEDKLQPPRHVVDTCVNRSYFLNFTYYQPWELHIAVDIHPYYKFTKSPSKFKTRLIRCACLFHGKKYLTYCSYCIISCNN